MKPAKILIADDGRVMRTIISSKLRERGYTVSSVASGREALESVEDDPPDLLILDIHMPDLDGLEALKRLRQHHTSIQLPVIMATANDEDEDVIKSFRAGANDFVSKPINFPVLFARMETHLKLKAAIEDLKRLGKDT